MSQIWDKGPDGPCEEEDEDESESAPIEPTIYEFRPCLTFCLWVFDHAKGVAAFGALWAVVCLAGAAACLAIMALDIRINMWSGFDKNVGAAAFLMVEVGYLFSIVRLPQYVRILRALTR